MKHTKPEHYYTSFLVMKKQIKPDLIDLVHGADDDSDDDGDDRAHGRGDGPQLLLVVAHAAHVQTEADRVLLVESHD